MDDSNLQLASLRGDGKPKWSWFITLEDCDGYTRDVDSWEQLPRENVPKVKVPQGTLVEHLTDDESALSAQYFDVPLNYRNMCNRDVWLQMFENALYPVNSRQKELLIAIPDCHVRSTALNQLDWVERLQLGFKVTVLIADGTRAMSVIRYVGKLRRQSGTHFGVELLECRGQGCSDGLHNGCQYFTCATNCALFVAMDQLIIMDSNVTSHEVTGGHTAVQFDVGDRVICHDDGGSLVRGVVRWVGTNQPVLHSNTKVYGIETERLVHCGNFNICLKEMDHLFTVACGHSKLFLPANHVEEDREANAVPLPSDQSILRSRYNLLQEQQKEEEALNRRVRIQQSVQQLQLMDNSGIDETMLDPERQKKIFDQVDDDKKLTRSQSVSAQSCDHQPASTTPPHLMQQQFTRTISVPSYHGRNVYTPVSGQHGETTPLCEEEPLPEDDIALSSSQWLLTNAIPPPCTVATSYTTVCTSTLPPDLSDSYQPLPTITDFDIQLGSKVMYGDPPLFGVVRWIGQLGTRDSNVAGIELEEPTEWGGDGTHNGELQFSSQPGRGAFVSLSGLQLDNRELIHDVIAAGGEPADKSELETVKDELHQLQVQFSHIQYQYSTLQCQMSALLTVAATNKLWLVSRDQFQIGAEIDRGAWATVHQATFQGVTVAAKCLHHLINTAETQQLFRREMDLCLYCQHQNIVRFLGATMEESPVILLELMDTSLRKANDENQVKENHFNKISLDVASALLFLHTLPNPVVHCHVNSANVLLKATNDGMRWMAKLGDLGAAKMQQLICAPSPGTVAYAAPEMTNPRQHSIKMDVYSFGVLLIEIVTRTLPFQRIGTLKATVKQQYPQYFDLVTECTRYQPHSRPSMHHIIDKLHDIEL